MNANEAEADSGDIAIRYKNDTNGLRQDFLIQQAPPGPGPLRLNFLVERSGVDMRLDTRQSSMHFIQTGSDVNVMQYRDVTVLDAHGQTLPSAMEQPGPDLFSIVVDDQNAQYPILVDPSLVSDGIVTNSGASGATGFGTAVAYIEYWHVDSADTIGGLLVGAPYIDNGSGAQAGGVFFFNSNGTNLPSTATWSYLCPRAYAAFGLSVADGGATNVDDSTASGYHAILVGAPDYNPDGNEEGAAFAFYPDGSGNYPSSPSWTALGRAGYARFGTSVAGNAYFSANNWPAAIVGSPGFATNALADVGQVCVFLGNGNGYDTTADWLESGPENSQFGSSVAWGKVQTNIPALLVGAPFLNGSSPGSVYEFLDPSGSLHTTADAVIDGQANGDEFGWSIASGADQNDDSYDDLLVGAPDATYDSMSSAGMVYLYRGSSTGLATTNVWSIGGAAAGALLGYSVALGDMNADNYADIIMGAPHMSSTGLGLTENGWAYLYLTDTSTGLPESSGHSNEGLYSDMYMGTSVAYGNPLVNGDADMTSISQAVRTHCWSRHWIFWPGGSAASDVPASLVLGQSIALRFQGGEPLGGLYLQTF